MAPGFPGVQRLAVVGKPAQWGSNNLFPLLFLELLDKPIQPRPRVRAHMDELHAHASASASVSDGAARAHLSARHVENQLNHCSYGHWLAYAAKHAACAQHVCDGGVALPTALPAHQHSFGRFKPPRTSPVWLWRFDGMDPLLLDSSGAWGQGKSRCRMMYLAESFLGSCGGPT